MTGLGSRLIFSGSDSGLFSSGSGSWYFFSSGSSPKNRDQKTGSGSLLLVKFGKIFFSYYLNNILSLVPADSFSAREISDVDERVVEGREDVRHAEHEFTLADLRTQLDLNILLRFLLSLSWRHSLI